MKKNQIIATVIKKRMCKVHFYYLHAVIQYCH